jgi:hypothetical protein
MKKGTWPKREIPDAPPKRDVLPLIAWAGDEDDELEDLRKLLADQGYTGFARGPVVRFSWWPWR